MQRNDEAAARLALAAKLDPESVRVKLAGALLGVARAEYGNAGTRLLALDPADWLAAYSAAMGIAAMVEGRGETPGPEHVQAARRLIAVVGRHRPEVPNALARLAMIELRSEAGPTKETLRAIERARLMASGREDYAFIHAQVLAGLSDFDAARKVVGPLMSPAYPPAVRESARNLMRQVLQLQTAAQSSNVPSTEPGAAARSTAEGPAPSDPSPVFRLLQAGEQRIEGVLERIECRAGGVAVFHLRTSAGPASATAAGLAGVDFITYRDDLSGSVGCGPLKTPMSVYLTWRAGSGPPDARLAVAIEFLPK